MNSSWNTVGRVKIEFICQWQSTGCYKQKTDVEDCAEIDNDKATTLRGRKKTDSEIRQGGSIVIVLLLATEISGSIWFRIEKANRTPMRPLPDHEVTCTQIVERILFQRSLHTWRCLNVWGRIKAQWIWPMQLEMSCNKKRDNRVHYFDA